VALPCSTSDTNDHSRREDIDAPFLTETRATIQDGYLKKEASNTIIHVGLDVDDTQYHGSALNNSTGEGPPNRRLDRGL